MAISIKLWGQLRNLAGEELVSVESGQEQTLEAVVKQLAEQSNEKLSSILLNDNGECRHSTLVFINDVQVSWDDTHVVNDGAKLTLMSPIAGG